nr:MAG TPA: hypothetical protein [Caudoviricetes sp.]
MQLFHRVEHLQGHVAHFFKGEFDLSNRQERGMYILLGGVDRGLFVEEGESGQSRYIIRQSKSTRFPIKKYKNGTCFSRPVFCIPFTPRKGVFSPLLIVYFTSWKVVE